MPARVTSAAERWIEVDLKYKPFAKQNQFHASRAKYRLFGGAAGPGKSKALLFEAILQAHEHPGSNVLVLRRTFPELEQSLLTYFRKDVPRELYRSFNESKHIVTMTNGSTLRFGYCQKESDVYQYQGAEFLFIGIDELTLFTLRQWQFLTSRNRCPLPGAFPCMAGATNPGNIGHAWVKALWIDKKPASGMDHPDQYDPADYDFTPARVTDNPIYASDKSYLKTLRALPSHLRRAFLDGDWDVFAGQYFDRFDPAQSVFRPEEIEWKAWWPRWISVDWGFEHPAAAYWHAAVPPGSEPGRIRDTSEAGTSRARISDEYATLRNAERRGAERGHQTFTYREFVTRRTAPRDLAREIIARSLGSRTEDGRREKIDAIYLSPDAFARRTDEASIAEQMGDIFADAGFPRPVPADDDRVSGWMLMYQMLDAGEWFVTENCVELIRTLPTLVRDPARIEDIEKMDGDDACLAKGTLIECRRGLIPIEQIEPGDCVLTRRGWRKVAWSGITASRATRRCLRLSDGTVLIGTPHHPILINGEWAFLETARCGDRILRCIKKRSFIAAAVIVVTRVLRSAAIAFTSWLQVNEAIASYTATSGGMPMAPFPQAITFTTSTGTHSTTSSVISSVSPHGSIWLGIRKRLRNLFSKAHRRWQRLDTAPRFGTSPRRDESSLGAFLRNSYATDENGGNAAMRQDILGASLEPILLKQMQISLAASDAYGRS